MSVIQKIRDKYARISVIAIAISLLGFILMDAFAGRTGLFNNTPSNTIGKINGVALDRTEFEAKVKQREEQYKLQYREISDETRQQIMQQTWDEEVNKVILDKEYEKLGLTITEKETNDLLYGANPAPFLAQYFTDPKTGKFDAATARMKVNEILKSGSVGDKASLQEQIDNLKNQRLLSKYMTLLTNSIYMPKWFFEKYNVDNSLMGKLSFVTIPYSSISDSAVKVTDDEIKDYMNQHKDVYEQKQETRSVSYVVFNASASAKDSAAVRDEIEKLKPAFVATTDPANFIMQQNSTLPYYDAYLSKTAIQVPAKDSIFQLSKGAVYGPYLDENTYVLAKLIDTKVMPDSAKAKHILIQTNDPQSGAVLLADSVAKKRIDSIKTAIDKGAIFDSLAKQFSADKSSAEKGGLVQIPNQSNQVVSDYFGQGHTVKAFNDSIFNGRVGQKMIVKTEYGYHLIEILDLKNIEPHYKIAYMAKQIIPSNETDQEAHNQANLFAGDSRDLKSFNENWDKKLRTKGINKMPAMDIGEMDNSIPGLPPARQFIRKIFEANNGDVIGPERVGENYVVAVITEVTKPGLRSVNSVRTQIEPVLRNKKKAEIIVKNIGKVTTLEDVAAKQKPAAQIQQLDSVRFSGNSKIGFEPKVVGAVFNPSNKGKVVPEPIPGNQGVFVIRVDNITTVPVENANVEEQRKNYEMQMKQSLMNQFRQGVNPIVETLKRTANIKDNRASFY